MSTFPPPILFEIRGSNQTVSIVEAEFSPKEAFMLVNHTIGTLYSYQPEAIRERLEEEKQ
jgi:hypothetical protein